MSKNSKEPAVLLDVLMDDSDFSEHYEKPGKTFALGRWIAGVIGVAVTVAALTIPVALGTTAAANASIDYWNGLENDLAKDEIRLPQHTVLLDKDGKEFAQFYSENRKNVELDAVSPDFIEGLIATEDSRFYENNGFDPVGLMRSAVSTTTGAEKQGASGITQQLVKNILILNAENDEQLAKVQNRVISTKLQEIKYSIHMTDKYSKDEILEMYLNTVYFGNRAYGIHAAAKTYFDTTPDKLTLEQAATLAGVINNPTIFDPFTETERSTERRDTVLYRMLVTGKVTQEEFDKAVETPMETKQGTIENGCGQSDYPYYCQLVRQEILSNPAFGKDAEAREIFLYRGGLTVKTAMDPKAMDEARKQAVRAYDDENRVATAIATVEPGTGKIVAIGQNRSWGNGEGKTEIIYAKSKRQTGSSFKPFTLATALEQGIPATTRMNSNSYYTPPSGYTAPPGGFSNFGYFDYGSVDGYRATKMSMNVWFVKLMERTGVVPVAELANRIGLSIPTEGEGSVGKATLSLTLGAWESSPLEMATAYATFASGGIKCNPVSILEAKRTDTGEELPVSDPDCHQAVMPNIANTVTDVLHGPLEQGGSAQNLGPNLAGGRDVVGKTGTTDSYADAWMVGYTPQYATAVWTGDPRGGAQYPLTSFVQYGQWIGGGTSGDGAVASGPVWRSYMDGIHEGLKKEGFPKPSQSVGSAITARTVPNVVGLDVNTAITVLQSLEYKPVIVQETTGDANILPKNTVVSQTPTGGHNGTHGQQVEITLSPGSDTSIVVSEKKEK